MLDSYFFNENKTNVDSGEYLEASPRHVERSEYRLQATDESEPR